jgi:excisionase family DNA binding protein
MGSNTAITQPWVGLQEAAEIVGVDQRTMRRWIARGDVPAFRLNRRPIRIRRTDLDALLKPIPAGSLGGVHGWHA